MRDIVHGDLKCVSDVNFLFQRDEKQWFCRTTCYYMTVRRNLMTSGFHGSWMTPKCCRPRSTGKVHIKHPRFWKRKIPIFTHAYPRNRMFSPLEESCTRYIILAWLCFDVCMLLIIQQCLTGDKPFSKVDRVDMVSQLVRNNQFPTNPEYGKEVTGVGKVDCESLMRHCWHKAANARPSAPEVADRLKKIIRDIGEDWIL